MNITSPSFGNNDPIPKKYTCDGDNINPPLTFSEIAKEANSLVLIVEDPDAPSGIFTHWLLYNIPITSTIILENSIPEGAMSVMNDMGTVQYGGPCPPSGIHRYYFRLYALNTMIRLHQGASKDEVKSAMDGHVIATCELLGLYKRE